MSTNAANDIIATTRKLSELLLRKKYQVKYFQREYKWQKSNIEDLLVDLERSFMSNYSIDHTRDNVPDYDSYYMGPVVLYREKTTFVIVDGQQRLTSFTLLLIYLIHLQKLVLKNNSKRIQNLDEYIFSQPFERETLNLEIKERESILKCLFEAREVKDEYITNESAQNIYDRFIDILEMFPVTLKHEATLPLFVSWLSEKLIFIEIMAQSSDSAYTIFESMNDRGLKLTQTELLKSYLLSNVIDEPKIKDLDTAWKAKIALLKTYSYDEDEQFFKAWLRAKYAKSIRPSEKGATNQDFEKIGTRFSNWVQESSKRILGLNKPEAFFYFVHSDFHFFSDLYIKLSDYHVGEEIPEHTFKLISYRGISASLSYPFILSTISKIDEEATIALKINLCVKYLDSLAGYRMLLGLPISQSSIDYTINSSILEIRDKTLSELHDYFKSSIESYKKQFLKEVDFIKYDLGSSKYVLARLFKNLNPNVNFEQIFFQRKKDSYYPFQFITFNDAEKEVHKIPSALKDIIQNSLCSYVIVPRHEIITLNAINIAQRIKYLISKGYLLNVNSGNEFDPNNLTDFFIKRNKQMKEQFFNLWKI